MDHQLRRAAVAAELEGLGVDALLVTQGVNVRYLTGFTGSNGQAIVGRDHAVFLTDGRYTERSRREVPDLERITYAQRLGPALAERCGVTGIKTLGFEADAVTVSGRDRLVDALPGVEFVPTTDVVERRRWAKDPEELQLLRAAQAVTDAAFEEILERLAVGVSEHAIALELERLLREQGADGNAFEPIVAFGESAAEPHHDSGHRLLEEGDVIKLDFGGLASGYHADMTRTVAFGEPASELKKIHDTVRQAQQAGIDAVRAGALASEVDAAARGVIEDAGYGDRFSHGLGHGVGLEIHEGPMFHRTSDNVLPAGAVMTVEPGIYVPGLGGVRIEDMVEVTEDGCRVLGTSTRDLIEL